jgi:hypothetical protein
MVVRYNFRIKNFTRYPVTGAVDSNVLESSLYIMKACPVMYTGLRQLRLFTTQTRPLINSYYNTPATTSTPFHTHPSIFCCNFTPHPFLHIPLQLHSSSIPIYSTATSFLTHPNISRCNSNSFPILKNNCAVAVALLRCMR